jgi:hypothetical protein
MLPRQLPTPEPRSTLCEQAEVESAQVQPVQGIIADETYNRESGFKLARSAIVNTKLRGENVFVH